MSALKQKFSLLTGIAMVVGVVIGSGIFFKADDVLVASQGSLALSLLAWAIGGAIMLFAALSFSVIAAKYSKANGLVDYAEAAYGKTFGFYVNWFSTVIYYPSLVAVLAWVSGLYTTILFGLASGDPSNVPSTWIFAFIYFIGAFALNYLSPKLAGKFQVSAMFIKLVPLILVAVFGTIGGLLNGVTLENLTITANTGSSAGGIGIAVLATAFAYDGWIAATSINAELKDSKKNLPLALTFGAIIVIAVYLLYNIGLAGTISNQAFVDQGNGAINLGVNTLFGSLASTILILFVVISCLGTLNGLTLAATRGLYSIGVRQQGFKPELFTKTSANNSPIASVTGAFFLSILWAIVWFGNFQGYWGAFMDTSELPIALLYGLFIAIFVWMMVAFKDENVLRRFIFPSLGIIGSIFIVVAAVQKDLFIVFVLITLALFGVGYLVNRRNNKETKTTNNN
jgi:APA family basic amino acid/polyamine antiporter